MTSVQGSAENPDIRRLRQRLDQHNYRENFTPESTLLVQRLFDDLCSTIENCQLFKKDCKNLEREKLEVEPLRRSVSCLTKENNQLRVEVIHAADLRDKEQIERQHLVRKYEDEIAELKFMDSQYMNKAQEAEKKLESEKKRIDAMLRAFDSDSGQGKGRKPKSASSWEPIVPEQIEIDVLLEKMPEVYKPCTPDPKIADIVNISHQRIEELERFNKDLSDNQKELEEQISNLENQITTREQEIARLGSLLVTKRSDNPLDNVGDIPTESASAEQLNSKIQQLEIQKEYLQEHILNLEQDKSKLEQERDSIEEEYKKEKMTIMDELRVVKNQSQQIYKDMENLELLVDDLNGLHSHICKKGKKKPKDSTGETSSDDTNNEKNKPDIKDYIRSIYSGLKSANDQLRTDFDGVFHENDNLKTALDSTKKEIERITKELNSTKERLKKLQSAAQQKNNNQKGSNANIEALQAQNKALEFEVAKMKSKIQELGLNNLNNQHAAISNVQNGPNKNLTQDLAAMKKERAELSNRLEECKKQIEALNNQLKEAHEEIEMVSGDRQNLEELYKQLNQELQIARHSLSPALHQSCNKKLAEVQAQLNNAQNEIQNLDHDRKSLEQLYQQVCQELQVLQQITTENKPIHPDGFDLNKQQSNNIRPPNLFDQSGIQQAKATLKRMEEEMNTVRDRFQKVNARMIDGGRTLDAVNREAEKLKLERDQLTAELEANKQSSKQFTEVLAERNKIYSELQNKENQVQYLSELIAKKDQEKENLMNSYSKLLVEHRKQNEILKKLTEESNKIKHLNEQIAQKDQEKENLMSSYRKLLAEHQKQDEILKESNNLKMEILIRDKRVQQLQKALDECSTEIQQYKTDLASYEKQCDILARTLQTLDSDYANSEKKRPLSFGAALSSKNLYTKNTTTLNYQIFTENLGQMQQENNLKKTIENPENSTRKRQNDFFNENLAFENNLKNYEKNKGKAVDVELGNENHKEKENYLFGDFFSNKNFADHNTNNLFTYEQLSDNNVISKQQIPLKQQTNQYPFTVGLMSGIHGSDFEQHKSKAKEEKSPIDQFSAHKTFPSFSKQFSSTEIHTQTNTKNAQLSQMREVRFLNEENKRLMDVIEQTKNDLERYIGE
ncbi:7441_t:CDS:10 [Ambispora gerdemannii]|uniref:7441_t:CDS:1 n=1 Tax=Ambispora gerdemannii TaxID=144530 RepID=A0A9N8YQ24_9GLOM|nr:7441_t:CDS:10 [Ambispora gerdemannii]